MKRFAFITIVLLLLSSCGSKSKQFKPSHLLTEQEMIDIMTDVQIIEADINYHKNQSPRGQNEETKDYTPLTATYYGQLFEHYGITDSIFSENMRYYSERPEALDRIMDSVVQRLTSSIPQPTDR